MTRLEALVAAAGSLLLAVVLTWPLAADPARLGRSDSGDGRYSLWNVAWVAHALTTRPASLYEANIFDPAPHALAYSEANLVAGTLAVPVWAATHNPYWAMNVLILLSFVLAAVTAYALARRLTGSRAGAALAALTFAFCPFIYSHLPHIQLLMSFGLPLVLLAMHAFVDGPSVRRAAVLGASMALAGLACGYYGVFGGLAAGLGVLWFGVAGRRRDVRYWWLGAAAAVIAVLIVAPFYLPYFEIRAGGFGRSLDDARLNSADWRAYFASPMILHAWLLPLLGSWKEVLFPGFLALGLGLGGAVTALRVDGFVMRRATAGFYVVLGLLALWASFGPDAGLYAWLHASLPVFAMLRAPSRLGLVVTLALAVLSAEGLRRLLARFAAPARGLVTAGVLAASAAGSVTASFNLVPAPEVPSVYRTLAGLPRAPVVELPFFSGASERHRHTEYMLMSTVHWQPLVNGYSDYIPARAVEDMRRLSTFPSAGAWDAIREHGARYMVVHWDLFDPAEARRLREAWDDLRPRLRLIKADRGVELYEVLAAAMAR